MATHGMVDRGPIDFGLSNLADRSGMTPELVQSLQQMPRVMEDFSRSAAEKAADYASGLAGSNRRLAGEQAARRSATTRSVAQDIARAASAAGNFDINVASSGNSLDLFAGLNSQSPMQFSSTIDSFRAKMAAGPQLVASDGLVRESPAIAYLRRTGALDPSANTLEVQVGQAVQPFVVAAVPMGGLALLAQGGYQFGQGLAQIENGQAASGVFNVAAGALTIAGGRASAYSTNGRVAAVGESIGANSSGTEISIAVLAEQRVGFGVKGQGSGNKIDQISNQQVVGVDGNPLPVYPNRPNGPFATQEFPSSSRAHGFPDMVDNYAGDSTPFQLENGSTLFQLPGGLNGTAGRFEWIVDPRLGGTTHRMFVPNGTINGIPVLP